jgi:hypothetical protein
MDIRGYGYLESDVESYKYSKLRIFGATDIWNNKYFEQQI